MRTPSLLFSLIALALPAAASGAWMSQGNPVCTASGDQDRTAAVSDGSGGMVILWRDARGSDHDLYAKHVLGNGNAAAGWNIDGNPVCTATGDQDEPSGVVSGDGFFVVWSDTRFDPGDIYLTRIRLNGSHQLEWPANGTVVCDATGPQGRVFTATDGGGGVYIAWYDSRTGFQVYASRFTSSGTKAAGWPTNGLLVADGEPDGIVADGSGGLLIAYIASGAARVKHLLPNGTFDPVWPASGCQLSTGAVPYHLRIVSDTAGGAYVTWFDSNWDVRVQRVTALGTIPPGWLSSGYAFTTTASDYEPAALGDGSGGVYVSWESSAGSGYDVRVGRLGSNGAPSAGWPSAGIQLSPASSYEPYPMSLCLGSGVITAWDRGDVYAQSVSSDGQIQWSPGGVGVCTATNYQSDPQVVTDGAGGALIAWRDERNGDRDIYATRLLPSGTTAVPEGSQTFPFQARLVSSNPITASARWALRNPGGTLSVEILDCSGRLVRAIAPENVSNAGESTVTWNLLTDRGTRAVPGLYFVRIRCELDVWTGKVALLN